MHERARDQRPLRHELVRRRGLHTAARGEDETGPADVAVLGPRRVIERLERPHDEVRDPLQVLDRHGPEQRTRRDHARCASRPRRDGLVRVEEDDLDVDLALDEVGQACAAISGRPRTCAADARFSSSNRAWPSWKLSGSCALPSASAGSSSTERTRASPSSATTSALAKSRRSKKRGSSPAWYCSSTARRPLRASIVSCARGLGSKRANARRRRARHVFGAPSQRLHAHDAPLGPSVTPANRVGAIRHGTRRVDAQQCRRAPSTARRRRAVRPRPVDPAAARQRDRRLYGHRRRGSLRGRARDAAAIRRAGSAVSMAEHRVHDRGRRRRARVRVRSAVGRGCHGVGTANREDAQLSRGCRRTAGAQSAGQRGQFVHGLARRARLVQRSPVVRARPCARPLICTAPPARMHYSTVAARS